MGKETKRLSKGFWHSFIPNTDKLISPQNIKLEIWDLSTHKVIDKFHPQIFGVRNCAFSPSGSKFILSGGCQAGECEFKIYDTNRFEMVKEFWIPEQSDYAVFTGDDEFLFGSWDGNIFHVNINDTIPIYEETKIVNNKKDVTYFINSDCKNRLIHIKNTLISLVEFDMDSKTVFAVASSKTENSQENSLTYSNYILAYNLKTKHRKEIKLPTTDKRFRIKGIKYMNGKLAILTTIYGGIENDNVFHLATLFLYNLSENKLSVMKENFKVRDVFSENQSISWSVDNKLAFISLYHVGILDMTQENQEIVIPFDRPTSVVFSENGQALAIGGDKAILYNLK